MPGRRRGRFGDPGVHGFASLALAGHDAVPMGRQRHAALESALEFGVLGLCAATPPRGTSRSR